MASFVVMTPPDPEGGALPEFVRDGFSIGAFVVPPLWLAWHRLWIEAAIALVLILVIPAIAARFGVGPAASWLSLLVSLFVGLEGSTLRLAALRRRGWTDAAAYEAADLQDAETRFACAGMWTGPAA